MAQTIANQLTALIGNVERGDFTMVQLITKLATIINQMNNHMRKKVQQQFWLAPDAAAVDNACTQKDLNGVSAIFSFAGEAAPDYPRNVKVTGTQLTGVTSLTLTVTGKDQFGVSQTETHTVTTAAKTSTGNIAFSGVPVIECTALTGTGNAGDLIDVGYDLKFGLNADVLSEADALVKVNLDEADAGLLDGSVDGTYNTITFETAPNASRDFMVWFLAGNTTETFMVSMTRSHRCSSDKQIHFSGRRIGRNHGSK
jgi:hypothetical protein